ALGALHGGAGGIAGGGAVGGQPGADAARQAGRQADEGPDAADQHGAHPEVAGLAAPDLAGLAHGSAIDRRRAVDRRVDGDRHQPVEGAADEHQDRDVQPDDEADADQGRRQVAADVEDRSADLGGGRGGVVPKAQAGGAQLEEAADGGGRGDAPEPAAAGLAELEHLGGGDALREAQRLLDDERAPERDGEED